MFDWDDLRIFLAVARARRIAPAARALGIDATTVMRRLARLSCQLDSELFDSVGGERHLTERGQLLFDRAEAVESAAFSAQNEVGGEARSLSGQVRLSVPEGFASFILAPSLPKFRQQFPQVELDINTSSGFLTPSRRQIDIAIMLAKPRSGRFTAHKLGDYRLNLYAARGYLSAHDEPLAASDLAAHCLVSYVPDLLESPELDYLGEIGPGLVATLRSTSINVQHQMIAAGCGVGLLPAFIGERDARLKQVLSDAITLTRSFWIVCHADRVDVNRIKAVQRFLSELKLDSEPVTAIIM